MNMGDKIVDNILSKIIEKVFEDVDLELDSYEIYDIWERYTWNSMVGGDYTELSEYEYDNRVGEWKRQRDEEIKQYNNKKRIKLTHKLV